MQPRIFGFVDDAHPAAAQLLEDVVVRDGAPDHASPSQVEVPTSRRAMGIQWYSKSIVINESPTLSKNGLRIENLVELTELLSDDRQTGSNPELPAKSHFRCVSSVRLAYSVGGRPTRARVRTL